MTETRDRRTEPSEPRTRVAGMMLPGLRDARADAALTLRELEDKSGVPAATISKLELERRGALPRTAGRLAKALETSVRELRDRG